MTRLQKKCFVFSACLHGLLAGIVFCSAAFRTRPEPEDLQVLSMIPASLLDRAGGAGGGTPAPRTPAPLPPAAVAPEPAAVVVKHVEAPKPREETPAPRPSPRPPPVETPDPPHDTQNAQRAAKPVHEIHVSYATASSVKKKQTENAETSASSPASEQKRLKQVESSLSQLASGVQTSGADKTIVDVSNIGGGGESFANYREAIYSIYYHGWITQDSVADQVGGPVARIVVARDGSVLSAELVTPSGDRLLDKSVERVLRLVTKLPPFPKDARDEERTFRIRFNLDAKKASG
jgi:TonB family protein